MFTKHNHGCLNPGSFTFGAGSLLPEETGGETGSGGSGEGKPDGKGGDAGKTFGQADVDRIVAERITRERAKYGDYEDLKAKAAKLDEHEAANASEVEKATKKAREEGAAEARAAVTRDRVLDRIEIAASGKFHDVTDARLRLGERHAEFVGKDGSIDKAAIATAVDEALKAAPHLKAAGTGRPRPDGAQGNPDDGKRSKAQDGLDEAKRRGWIKD